MHQAGITLNEISKLTESTSIVFLKNSFEFVKIRTRQYEPNFNNIVGLMITKISGLAGIKDEIDMATKSDLLRFIKTRCGDITLEEIYKAFELERYGEYPEKSQHYQLFGTEYFSQVIKKYRTWKHETRLHHNITKSDPVALLPDISESQKKERLINGIIRIFNGFKQSNEIEFPFVWVFDELQERGLIKGANTPVLEKYYADKMAEAKIQVQNELEIEKSISTFIKRKTIAREIEEVLHGNSSKVIIATKKIVLKEYFEKLIREEIEIESLLK